MVEVEQIFDRTSLRYILSKQDISVRVKRMVSITSRREKDAPKSVDNNGASKTLGGGSIFEMGSLNVLITGGQD